MVSQYPDTIKVTIVVPPMKDVLTGKYTPGSSTAHTFRCRAEINKVGSTISGVDGSQVNYTFDVYMPQITTLIPDGTSFVLATLMNGVINGKTKRASNGQYNSRLWL